MSRILERLHRKAHEQRGAASDDEALDEALNLLGKRALARVEGAMHRGLANLSTLPQQLFAEVESSLGSVDARPRVQEAVGKLTAVMESVARMAPPPMNAVEVRNTALPDPLRDRLALVERDREDDVLHRDRLEVLSSSSTQAKRRARGQDGRFDVNANVSETLALVGLTGFTRGASAAHAAITGSLHELLHSAEQALGPGSLDERPDTTSPAEREKTERATQTRGDLDAPPSVAQQESATAATDRNVRHAIEEQEELEAQDALEGLDAPGAASRGLDAGEAQGATAEARAEAPLRPTGFSLEAAGAGLAVDAHGLALRGGAGSLQINRSGVTGSLRSPLGDLSLGRGGLSASLATDAVQLQLDGGGLQLDAHTSFGGLSAGRGGLELRTPVGSLRAGGGGVTGHLEGLGAIDGRAGGAAEVGLGDTAEDRREGLGAPRDLGAAGAPPARLPEAAAGEGASQWIAEVTDGLSLTDLLDPARDAIDSLGKLFDTTAATLAARPDGAVRAPAPAPAPAALEPTAVGGEARGPTAGGAAPSVAVDAATPSATAGRASSAAAPSPEGEPPRARETSGKAASNPVAARSLAAREPATMDLDALEVQGNADLAEAPTPTRAAIDHALATPQTIGRDGTTFETQAPAELRRPTTGPLSAAPPPPLALASVPVPAASPSPGTVTQPDLQLRGQGESPPTPAAPAPDAPLAQPSHAGAPSLAQASSEPAPDAPARPRQPTSPPAALPRAPRPTAPTLAGAARGRIAALKVASPGELALPSNALPARSTSPIPTCRRRRRAPRCRSAPPTSSPTLNPRCLRCPPRPIRARPPRSRRARPRLPSCRRHPRRPPASPIRRRCSPTSA